MQQNSDSFYLFLIRSQSVHRTLDTIFTLSLGFFSGLALLAAITISNEESINQSISQSISAAKALETVNQIVTVLAMWKLVHLLKHRDPNQSMTKHEKSAFGVFLCQLFYQPSEPVIFTDIFLTVSFCVVVFSVLLVSEVCTLMACPRSEGLLINQSINILALSVIRAIAAVAAWSVQQIQIFSVT